eukprot:TRINITY_DN3722_c0_g1_i1.p1 TRINITY_DN3722_c0_g1~~TRINITY_DN3722_c0_g1_i1.p1  ORF type:complete len:335 (+),score=55.20 TRINITY_DN3722_c0_g1_i1:742-1746(+)
MNFLQTFLKALMENNVPLHIISKQVSMSEEKINRKPIREVSKALDTGQVDVLRAPSNSWGAASTQIEKEKERHTTPPIEIRRPNSKRALNREERTILKVWRSQCPQTAFLCSFHEKLSELKKYSLSSAPITLSESVKRFVVIYMRNGEDQYEQVFRHCLKRKKKAVEEFKVQHPKLTRDEWDWLTKKLKKAIHLNTLSDASKETLFSFVSVCSLGNITPSCSFSSSSGSECAGLLRKALMEYSESDDLTEISEKSVEKDFTIEIILNYFCIYFPNYTELWCSDVHILTKKLRALVGEFLVKHPFINREVMDIFLNALEKLTTPVCYEESEEDSL